MFGTTFYNVIHEKPAERPKPAEPPKPAERPKPIERPKPVYTEAMSAKEIYDYLDERVIKQDEAKKAAAMIMWKCLRGIKQNIMFCGPTGCGKTEIWRCLHTLFPYRIAIVDVSSLTMEGFSGNTKWQDLFRSEHFRDSKYTIMVLDETDKMLSPRFTSTGENVSEHIMSEGLKIIEGTNMKIKMSNDNYRYVDTNKISFVLLGAFSRKAEEIAEKQRGSSMGFGSEKKDTKAYSKPITVKDILDYGVTPEFMGRISKIVNLSPMTKNDYESILYKEECSPIKKLEKIYNLKIYLTAEHRDMVLENAMNNGLGIRGMANELANLLDERLFEGVTGDCVFI